MTTSLKNVVNETWIIIMIIIIPQNSIIMIILFLAFLLSENTDKYTDENLEIIVNAQMTRLVNKLNSDFKFIYFNNIIIANNSSTYIYHYASIVFLCVYIYMSNNNTWGS